MPSLLNLYQTRRPTSVVMENFRLIILDPELEQIGDAEVIIAEDVGQRRRGGDHFGHLTGRGRERREDEGRGRLIADLERAG